VAVESYKFARVYPLSQTDVSDMCADPADSSSAATRNPFAFTSRPSSESVGEVEKPAAVEITAQRPVIDFTPAEYISLLFTDLGILTPAAVSDELIRLYQ
jgi:translation initiation factor eIF-2B subunit alpha